MRVDFLRLKSLGYYPLLPIIPPEAPLPPDAPHVLALARGKVPGLRQLINGKPAPYFTPLPGWLQHRPTDHELRWYSETDCNAGLPLGDASGIACLDLDITNPDIATAAVRAVSHAYPQSPMRIGNAPRAAFYYRLVPGQASVRRRRIKFIDPLGTEQLIELLGTGQQSVIAGIHPKTHAWFSWQLQAHGSLGQPAQLPPPADVMPQLSADELIGIPDRLMEALGQFGCKVVSVEGRSTGGAAVRQDALLAPSMEALRAAVSRMPNAHAHFPTRAAYLNMAYAIKASAGPDNEAEAFQLFLDWCERWDGGTNDYDTVASDWRRAVPEFRIGWDWLQHQARDLGVELGDLDFSAEPGPAPATGSITGPAQQATLGTFGLDDAPAPAPVPWSHEHCVARVTYEHGWAFLHVSGGQMRGGDWLRWNGRVWQLDEGGKNIFECIRRTVGRMAEELRAGDPSAQALTKARSMASDPFYRGCLNMLSRSLLMNGNTLRFDGDPWLLNTPAGHVDLRTGQLGPHDPLQHCRQITSVAPILNPRPDDWSVTRAWLLEIFKGDVEVVQFILNLAALWITGYTGIQRWYFLFGTGGNGKGTWLRLLQHILGNYALATSAETFQVQRGGKVWVLPSLKGKRLVYANEAAGQAAWNMTLLNSLSGGDAVEGEAKYAAPEALELAVKVVIAGNNMPRMRTVDNALRRRFVGILFPLQLKEDQINPAIQAQLEREAPALFGELIKRAGMLYRAIAAGASAMQLMPLPLAVQRETLEQLEEQDTLGEWINSRCLVPHDGSTPIRDLWRDFREGMLEKFDHNWTINLFSTELRKRGFYKVRPRQHHQTVCLHGIALRYSGNASAQSEFGDVPNGTAQIINIRTGAAMSAEQLGAEGQLGEE